MDYGLNAVVRLEVVGESLVFQLPNGRVTTVVKAKPKPASDEDADQATQ